MLDFEKYHLTITDKKAKKLISIFLHISFFICLIGIITLYIYNSYFTDIALYKSSIIIFRTGILIAIFSVICGIFFSNYEFIK